LDACLARIALLDPEIGAFQVVDAEAARGHISTGPAPFPTPRPGILLGSRRSACPFPARPTSRLRCR
jgi:hypothetical protein